MRLRHLAAKLAPLAQCTWSVASPAQGLHGVRRWFYGEHVMHDFRIVLVSPEGQVVASMTMADQDLAALLP